MKTTRLLASVVVLAINAALPLAASAQSAMDHSKMDKSQSASMTDGEVKKIDQDTGRITIKHGEIKSLDMPSMTMVFTAKDKSQLVGIKPGDKIKFVAANEGGKLVVTSIQPAK